MFCVPLLVLVACRSPEARRAVTVPYAQVSGAETSLAGRDANRDGVRDDVSAALFSKVSGEGLEAALVAARAYQRLVVARTDWEVDEAGSLLLGARICLKAARPGDWAGVLQDVRRMVLNNVFRQDAARRNEARMARRPAAKVTACPAGQPGVFGP